MVSISVAVKKKKKRNTNKEMRVPWRRNTIFSFISFYSPSPLLFCPTQSPVIKHHPPNFSSPRRPFPPSPPPLFFVYLYPHRQRRAVKQRRRVELTACSLEIQKGKTLYAVCGRNVFVPFANKARRVEQIILQRRPGLYSTWPACLPACARLKRFVGETWGET